MFVGYYYRTGAPVAYPVSWSIGVGGVTYTHKLTIKAKITNFKHKKAIS